MSTSTIGHMPTGRLVAFNELEENRYMLAVNEAVGFVALAYESAWKRVL